MMTNFDKAIVPLLVPFVVALVKHFVPDLPDEIIKYGAPLLGALLVYFTPNK